MTIDVLALCTLGVMAWVVAGFLLRDDLFIYGDHPGQFWRFWYTLNVALPLHNRLIDWIPYWYAGYPEMQFYPPGFVLVGWLLNLLTFGTLSTALLYESVVFVSYLLPGLSFYYALRHLRFERAAAFTAGLFGLIFPEIVGGVGVPFVGMIGSRLAWGLNAFILVWGIDFLEARGARYGWLAGGALALAILAHATHVFGIAVALTLYVLVRRLPLLHAGARLLALGISAAALDAFWLIPLFAHSGTNVIPILRATLDQTVRHLTDLSLLPYILPALVALARLAREKESSRRATLTMLILLPVLIAAIILADHFILVERLGIYQLDPVRLLGEYYLPLVWLAAIGVGEIAQRISRAAWCVNARVLSTGLITLIGGTLLTHFVLTDPFPHLPNGNDTRFLSNVTSAYRLDELWEVLRQTEGRVMFTSFYARLDEYGYNTTLPALSPLFTKRQIMGGTFSHW